MEHQAQLHRMTVSCSFLSNHNKNLPLKLVESLPCLLQMPMFAIKSYSLQFAPLPGPFHMRTTESGMAALVQALDGLILKLPNAHRPLLHIWILYLIHHPGSQKQRVSRTNTWLLRKQTSIHLPTCKKNHHSPRRERESLYYMYTCHSIRSIEVNGLAAQTIPNGHRTRRRSVRSDNWPASSHWADSPTESSIRAPLCLGAYRLESRPWGLHVSCGM